MSVIVSIDLGTTKITSLAVDVEQGTILARGTVLNDADVTRNVDRSRGRSEWDAGQIVQLGCQCLRDVAERLGERRQEVVGVGITGQQHGVVLVDSKSEPLTPLINWQDRRGHDAMQATGRSYLETARELLGETAVERTGCRLHPGFSGLTLFWLKENGLLPAAGRACFIMDLFGAVLTGSPPITEPSCAGSSGLLNVRTRSWDREAIGALGLPQGLFLEIREADQTIGPLSATAAETTGLPAGIPVFAPIGDHQASFLGSLRNIREDVLVNVGTGAQVAVYTDADRFAPPVELRPLPIRKNLLSNVGLAGGWSYQVLENFFRSICRDVFQVDSASAVYETLNRLAAAVPRGCDGLVCDPHFSGSRSDPNRRGAFHGVTPQNLTPGHFARAVLEGMAHSLAEGYRSIPGSGKRPHRRVVAAGNALRENDVLRESVRDAFGLPLAFTRHREEAAFGAALTAAVGAGVFPSLEEAATLIEYER
jgi:sugar (pentulose or hexulose) kinase